MKNLKDKLKIFGPILVASLLIGSVFNVFMAFASFIIPPLVLLVPALTGFGILSLFLNRDQFKKYFSLGGKDDGL